MNDSMVKVYITGTGAVKIARHYPLGVRDLAFQAGKQALAESGSDNVDFVIVASSLSYLQAPQLDLASYIASSLGLHGVRALSVEAGESSGLAALETAVSLIKSQEASRVLLIGVDKMTEHPSGPTYVMLQALYDTESDAYYNIGHAGIAALLMRLYMEKYEVDRLTLAYWPAMMHMHAKNNPHAMLPFAVAPEKVMTAMPIAEPITLLDAYPLGDGAAAIVLENGDELEGRPLAEIESVISATGMPSPALREDPLDLESLRTALGRLGGLEKIDVIELHDSFSIYGLLELETLGLAEKGESAKLVAEGYFSAEGEGPLVNPSGGLKARGHPIGATDVYKLVEVSRILAGTWQGVKRGDEETGMIVSINAAGSSSRIALLRKVKG